MIKLVYLVEHNVNNMHVLHTEVSSQNSFCAQSICRQIYALLSAHKQKIIAYIEFSKKKTRGTTVLKKLSLIEANNHNI